MSQKRKNKNQRHRGIYVLPNLFTTMSLFAGFYSILCSIQARFVTAAIAILVAGVLDALDGTVARMTNTTSRFGVEYDSLCDLIAFGAAPSILVYLWALKPNQLLAIHNIASTENRLGVGLTAAFLFLACGALRLARFNVSAGQRDPGFFQGLPIPGGAALISAAVLWHHRTASMVMEPNGPLIMLLVIILAFLMVSNLDYFSLKNRVITKNNHPFETLVLAVIFLAFLIVKAKTILLPLGLIFLASGPVVTLIRRRIRAKNPVAEPEEETTQQ